MAWFRRSTHDPAELDRVKSEIQVLRNTLEAQDRRRREAANAALTTPPVEPAGAQETRARLDEFATRLADLDTRLPTGDDTSASDAATRFDELTAKLAELDARVGTPSSDAPPASPGTVARLDELANKLTDLEGRVGAPAGEAPETAGRLDELAAKLAELDARITSVSTELANQVSELGNDIESLANRPADERGAVDEVVIGELRDGQTRLANEQARYQIAFREDLARLAEQFRRPGST